MLCYNYNNVYVWRKYRKILKIKIMNRGTILSQKQIDENTVAIIREHIPYGARKKVFSVEKHNTKAGILIQNNNFNNFNKASQFFIKL